MDYLTQQFHGFFRRVLPQTKAQNVKFSRVDAYLSELYRVLIWDDPKLSFSILAVSHILLWLFVQFELRFYGTLSVLILVILVCDWYFETNNFKPERNISSDAIKVLARYGANISIYLRALRKENPSAFCFVMCSVFLGLTIVARSISGFALLYLLLVTIFAVPLVVSKIPPEYLRHFKEVMQTIGTNEGVLAESELLPYIAHKNLNDHDPELDSLLTDRTADSVTNSLISGIASMPSHLDADDNLELDDEDVEFAITAGSAVSFTPGECSTDSDSDHKNMNFESSHFNRDSSSDDDFSRDLQFAEARDEVAKSSRNVSSILSSLGGLISEAVKPRKDSDSSDFEIIDTGEIDDM